MQEIQHDIYPDWPHLYIDSFTDFTHSVFIHKMPDIRVKMSIFVRKFPELTRGIFILKYERRKQRQIQLFSR